MKHFRQLWVFGSMAPSSPHGMDTVPREKVIRALSKTIEVSAVGVDNYYKLAV